MDNILPDSGGSGAESGWALEAELFGGYVSATWPLDSVGNYSKVSMLTVRVPRTASPGIESTIAPILLLPLASPCFDRTNRAFTLHFLSTIAPILLFFLTSIAPIVLSHQSCYSSLFLLYRSCYHSNPAILPCFHRTNVAIPPCFPRAITPILLFFLESNLTLGYLQLLPILSIKSQASRAYYLNISSFRIFKHKSWATLSQNFAVSSNHGPYQLEYTSSSYSQTLLFWTLDLAARASMFIWSPRTGRPKARNLLKYTWCFEGPGTTSSEAVRRNT
jgi:hypothetical protein